MRLARKEAPALQPASPAETAQPPRSLMTPARRAALDALELEFHDLLVQGILRDAGR